MDSQPQRDPQGDPPDGIEEAAEPRIIVVCLLQVVHARTIATTSAGGRSICLSGKSHASLGRADTMNATMQMQA